MPQSLDEVIHRFQDCSLVPVDVATDWQKGFLLERATEFASAIGYEDWKTQEIARMLEKVFCAAIGDGKTFDEAVAEVDAALNAGQAVKNA